MENKISSKQILDFFLDNDFYPYLIETYLDTRIIQCLETLDEYIADVRYEFDRYGLERFLTLLDDEDFQYFPELKSIMLEWHARR